jgi:hypothetical protein
MVAARLRMGGEVGELSLRGWEAPRLLAFFCGGMKKAEVLIVCVCTLEYIEYTTVHS